jgi:glutamyl-Q tRNA(Asp) synthetase
MNNAPMTEITRFAPSPTGRLHLGHAFAAVQAAAHGRWTLRIEDIDLGRCRPEFTAALHEDLAWLGLAPASVLVQSHRIAAHRAALVALGPRLYPCTCTRTELAAAAPHAGETVPYPGTCRGRPPPPPGTPHALRLDLSGLPLLQHWHDSAAGPRSGRADLFGDPVLWRKDDAPAYHLACVLDDAHQGITLVTRGHDLEAATPLQCLLQSLLGLPQPRYLHHRLLLAADGRRLAKRDGAATLEALRAAGTDGPTLARRLAGIAPAGPDFAFPPAHSPG